MSDQAAGNPENQARLTDTEAGDLVQHYRERIEWDEVQWASHCIDCYPGNCPMRVYKKDGKIVREEQAAVFPTVQEGVPDMNPMGCQKGAGWGRMLKGKERVTHPLKRVGERGEGKWERISWNEATTIVADAMLDAIEEVGPESIIAPSGCNSPNRGNIMGMVGGLTMDLNAEMNDFAPGQYLTFGMFDPVSSVDDWFHSDVFVIWFSNPAYTRIPHNHYILEARYKGADVVTIAPDLSPSAVHSDYHVGLRPGTDAAFALSMCNVVVEEGLVDEQFVREQTDLGLLAFADEPGRFLRTSDLTDGGSDQQFYAWDTKTGQAVEAPRGTLFWGEVEPALEGVYTVEGKDGPITVTPVLALIRARLNDYDPESAAATTGTHADTIRLLARKIAAGRTNFLGSLGNAGKHYHGDLMERAQLLLLALTGNWGKQGSGVRAWTTVGLTFAPVGATSTAQMLDMIEAAQDAAIEADPTLTPAIFLVEASRQIGSTGMAFLPMVPPVFFWHRHCGYDEIWNNSDWHDRSMQRPFAEYWDEAVDKDWWAGVDYPRAEHTPRVLIECGGNVLRRTRGGSNVLLDTLWPKLKMVVTAEVRMSMTALYSDIVLPVAAQYEKLAFGIPSTHTMNLTFCDRIVEPPGEALHEGEVFRLLSEKVAIRARDRGMQPYTDALGTEHDLASQADNFPTRGALEDEEIQTDTRLRDGALAGTLPQDASLETIRERGYFRWEDLGIGARAQAQATDPKPNETFVPFRKHVEDGEPWPTLTRRAQFLIEHPWFVQADEHLPRHKEAPKSGGDYPFSVSSGHNRWSIHSLNITNNLMLETHRGEPHVVMNHEAAATLGVEDDDLVRLYNDQGEFFVRTKLSSGCHPDQVIMYNGWEPYQHKDWKGANDAEPGMIKWLHMAGGYGHLKYSVLQWQPCPVMRNTRVGIEKIADQ
ncbi:MAG: molybdopterin-dependent oxidoreductase [Kiritimatiellia bacterium]|jgi:DMSO reductase family type II enzyme molybdopterin subunit|nr:molybdopterin-dependent oxidoreductase [Pseudomonadales bacterium]MDP6472590.1 molybdopterin-dependent oxidoreductase [Pseudomonadales bacterium]MDP6829261.1 molybdopterin-dependent oxidoreductase [Pseudomonadales bacterium]MDP7022785.1 molybdopterin-dependent oxidoreductase [Kiritimatiellia bacterium]